MDRDSWHLLAVDGNGEVQGCARYRHLTGHVGFDDLGVRDSWLAGCRQWGPSLREAVESEMLKAEQLLMGFSEVGGWAIVPARRGTTLALRIAMATFSLARMLGGCVGIGTATERHHSSSILRRIGGRSLEFRGTRLPSYYDPQYRCRMEVLRFDSRLVESSCGGWVDQLSKRMGEISVVVPAESHHALPKPVLGGVASTAAVWVGELSTPFQKFANVSENRSLTVAALIGAPTVREGLHRDTSP
jgi:hypothetical protein